MKIPVIAAIAALVVGMAPISSALADPTVDNRAAIERDASQPGAFLGVSDDAAHTGCPMSSASEGNANQQHFPVKQYGQTAGGTRC